MIPMKIKIALVYLGALIAIQGISQEKPFRFGFKVAPNIAWIAPDSEGYDNDGALIGFSWGFMADLALAENYFVKTGFNYDYLNSKLELPFAKDTSETGTLKREYNLRYLEVPLIIKMQTNKFGHIVYFGEIGLGTSFNLRAKSKDEFYDELTGSVENSEEDINDEIAFMKESLIVGAGIEYYFDASTSLLLGLTYNSGLTNILKDYNTRYPDIKQSGNLNYFQLNIGIIF